MTKAIITTVKYFTNEYLNYLGKQKRLTLKVSLF